MNRYGVIDIGSNTVVLVLYKVIDGKPQIVYHHSEPVHLIQYNKNNHLDIKGILKAKAVVKEYVDKIKEDDIQVYGGFITEPWRNIDNGSELFTNLNETGVNITPLTGTQEAEYDFLGSRLDCGDVLDGHAFDIGGGSTEFISFKDNKIIKAISIPYGCVRLVKLPVNQEYVSNIVQETLNQNKELKIIDTDLIIGIGGTVRAAGQLYNHITNKESNTIPTIDLEDILTKLLDEDKDMLKAMKQAVSKGRQEVFIPGLNMLVAICKAYGAKEMRISTGCVREGYLFNHLIDKENAQ